jgi:hypothetical protein
MQIPYNEQIKLLSDFCKLNMSASKKLAIKNEIARLIDKRIETLVNKIPEHTENYIIINSKINKK